MEEETVQAYLQRRECVLSRLHPNWATVFDHEDSTKRMICIPPSWDLIKSYTGTIPHAQEMPADFNKSAYKSIVVAGERGEADFLRRMQDFAVAIDGLLIGNIDSRHILNSTPLPTALSDSIRRVFRDLNCKASSSSTAADPAFEMDFVFIHPRIGFYQIEVKSTINPNNVALMLANGVDQIQRGSLQKLFGAFCEACGVFEWSTLWERYSAGGAVYFSGLDADSINSVQLKLQNCMKQSRRHAVNIIFEDVAGHFDQLVEVEPHSRWLSEEETLADHFDRMTANAVQKNFNYFFDEPLFRRFAVFLATYRPDCYISPILCAMQVYQNLTTQCLQSVNYYRKAPAGRHNLSNSAIAYLQNLKQRNLIQNSDVKFPGRSSDVYFTEEQLTAIAVFEEQFCNDCNDNHLTNTRQLIMGPPGSGKSLIVMMKLFILAQLRPAVPLVCVTWNAHSAVFRDFIKTNAICPQNGFQRTIQMEDVLPDFDGTRFDCVLDEQFPKPQLYHRFKTGRSKGDGCVSVAVVTGGLHLINENDKRLRNLVPLTVLTTSFRSTNAIQRHLRDTLRLPIPMVCGHSFEGIQPEIYDCSAEYAAAAALEERVRTLWLDLQELTKESVALLTTAHRRLFSDELLEVVMFYHPSIVPSLEFPIVIVFGEREMKHQLLAASRAICHLIMYTY